MVGLNEKSSNQRKSASAMNFIMLVAIPLILIFSSLMYVLPQILTATNLRIRIPSQGLFPDMDLEIIIESSVEDLDMGYFTSLCTMNLYIEENSTRKTSYNIIIVPMGWESVIYGVSVPFENLKHDAPYYSLNLLTGEWITYDKYSHSENFRMPIASKSPERFPADFYLSSTIYVWFDGAFYPEIKLSPSSSVPKGFILSLNQPKLVNATYFYLNILPRAHRLALGKPPNDVMAFEIVIQRDLQSLSFHLVYIVFILWFTYEALAISHIKIRQAGERLKIFAGLTIASIAFLLSIRQVVNVITWSEIMVIIIVGAWFLFEIKGALSE